MNNSTPDYWRWIYFLTREWDYPDDVEAAKVIGFSVIMSTFGKKGREIRPAAHTVGRRAGMTERLARDYRKRCIDLGLFRDTGKRYNCVPVLEISIPDKSEGLTHNEQTSADPWGDASLSKADREAIRAMMAETPVRAPRATARERQAADDEDKQPKYRTNPESGKRERAGF